MRRISTVRAIARVLFALVVFASPFGMAGAQEAKKPLPITTGTSTSAMDSPETNNELESYTHSPAVASLSKHLGLSTNKGSRLFEDFNSAVLIAIILYYLLKILPSKFRAKRQAINHDLTDARRATEDAQQRLKAIEARLASLGGEVDALRQQAAESSKAEELRIHASIEEERKRILHSVETEIAATQANAERGLKRYASDLAVDRAAERLQLTPEGDRALIDEFLQGLAGRLGKQGQN